MAQAVGESRNEDRHELGPSLENEVANAGLGIEEGVGILALVASPFRVEANQPASSFSAQVSKNPKGILIETASAGGVKEGRVHRPPGTDEVDQDAERRLIEKPAAHREVDVPPPARPPEEQGHHDIHVEEAAMIGREEERSLAAGGGDSFEPVDLEPGSDEGVYPARADLPATPAPESLPATLIHPANQTERRAFERGQGVELRSTGIPADSHPANPG
jgi:hypothetical protein